MWNNGSPKIVRYGFLYAILFSFALQSVSFAEPLVHQALIPSVIDSKINKVVTALDVIGCNLLYFSKVIDPTDPNGLTILHPEDFVRVDLKEVYFVDTQDSVEAKTLSVRRIKGKNPYGSTYPPLLLADEGTRSFFRDYLVHHKEECIKNKTPSPISSKDLEPLLSRLSNERIVPTACETIAPPTSAQLEQLFSNLLDISRFRENTGHDFSPVLASEFPKINNSFRNIPPPHLNTTFEHEADFKALFDLFNNKSKMIELLKDLEADLSNTIESLELDPNSLGDQQEAFSAMMSRWEKMGGFGTALALKPEKYSEKEWQEEVLNPGKLFHDVLFKGGEHGQETHRIQWVIYLIHLKKLGVPKDQIKETVRVYQLLGSPAFNENLQLPRLLHKKNQTLNRENQGGFWDLLFDWVNLPNTNFHNPGFLRSFILQNPETFPLLSHVLKSEEGLVP